MKRAAASAVYLRLALGVTFLYSVGDRLGFWGPPGTRGVNWGNFDRFLLYTAKITAFMPHAWTPLLGWGATVLETTVGVLLVVGLRTRQAALGSGVLLTIFALSMTATTGLGSALTQSVFSASAGAFLLSLVPSHPISMDAVLKRRRVEHESFVEHAPKPVDLKSTSSGRLAL
jgi:uncharacterized membrane protein YphA (DoxX/SURF4 family)